MASDTTVIYFGPGSDSPPDLLLDFGRDNGLQVKEAPSVEAVQSQMNRSYPACLVLDASASSEAVLELCHTIKSDAFTAIVPLIVLASPGEADLPSRALATGADEVLTDRTSETEKVLRLKLVLRRAARDVSVHPTTRLPGTAQIERDLAERLERGEKFAVCYADLDHFKEFNDRYGYNHGDSVILLLSKILRDLVRALAPGGFVGHIGGDDFIYTVPLDHLERCSDEVIHLFDELIPYQYTEEDRRAGYFLGKDRRGTLHRIPLMTLSVGVVTNQFQDFTHTAQLSERAAEMKSYAKTLPGSVYVVDRRYTDRPSDSTLSEAREEAGLEERGASPAPF